MYNYSTTTPKDTGPIIGYVLINTIIRYLLVFIIVSSVTSGSAQSIHKTGINQCTYNGQNYNYNDMAPVFAQDDTASSYYRRSLSNAKTSRLFGWSSVASFGAAVVFASKAEANEDHSVAGLTLRGLASVFGTVGILARVVVNVDKRKAINAFNDRDLGILKIKSKNSVDIGIAQNGIGLTLTF